jgi:hypothetical protein
MVVLPICSFQFALVPTLRVGTHTGTLRVPTDIEGQWPHATQSVEGTVPTRSVGTRHYK